MFIFASREPRMGNGAAGSVSRDGCRGAPAPIALDANVLTGLESSLSRRLPCLYEKRPRVARSQLPTPWQADDGSTAIPDPPPPGDDATQPASSQRARRRRSQRDGHVRAVAAVGLGRR